MKGSLMLIGAAIGFGLNPILAQVLLQQGMSPEVIALYRFSIPALLFLPYLKIFFTETAEALRTAALGAFAAIGMLAFLYSLNVLPATTVILSYYTYPLFALGIGCIFFHQRLTRNRLISAGLILLAVMILQNPVNERETPVIMLALCFIAPLSYALLINYVASPVLQLKAAERMGACLTGHLIVLVPLTFWKAPQLLLPQSEQQLWLILATGILAAALPQYLFARGTLLAGMEKTTMISTTEIVFALLFSMVLLNTDIARLEIIASMLILMSGLIRPEPDQLEQRTRTSLSQSSAL